MYYMLQLNILFGVKTSFLTISLFFHHSKDLHWEPLTLYRILNFNFVQLPEGCLKMNNKRTVFEFKLISFDFRSFCWWVFCRSESISKEIKTWVLLGTGPSGNWVHKIHGQVKWPPMNEIGIDLWHTQSTCHSLSSTVSSIAWKWKINSRSSRKSHTLVP